MSISTIIKEITKKKIFPVIIKYDNPKYSFLKTNNGQIWNRKGSKFTKKYRIVVVPSNLRIKSTHCGGIQIIQKKKKK